MSITIKKIKTEDARVFLELSEKLDNETEFRAFEPGERKTTVAETEDFLNKVINSGNCMIFLAFVNDKPAGILEAAGGIFNRNRHMAHINIAVLLEYTGKGIGRMLFEALEEWARRAELKRLELTVFDYNSNAIKLYTKMGYLTEGRKRASFKVNGKFVDEIMMAKLL